MGMRAVFASTLIVLLAACGRSNGPAGPSPVPIPPATGPSGLGVFAVTFAADAAACPDLPEQARSRTYAAALFPGGSIAVLTGAKFVTTIGPYSNWNIFVYRSSSARRRTSGSKTLLFGKRCLTKNYLVIFGDAHGEMNADSVTLPFGGEI